MGTFPKELLQQCLSSGDGDATEDSGAILQKVLSVLADCPSDSNKEWNSKQIFCLFFGMMENLDIDFTEQQQSMPKTMYWVIQAAATIPRYKATLQASIEAAIRNPSTTEDDIATFSMGLRLIAWLLQSPKIKPFEVHAVALQSLAFGSNHDDETAVHPFYWTLVVLLCTWSLQRCRDEIRQQHQPIRYKRIQSLLLETIQLYQRYTPVVVVEEKLDDDDEMDVEAPSRTSFSCYLTVPLWLDVILPIGQSLWYQCPPPIRTPHSMLWQAITVGVASRLIVQSSADDQPHWSSRLCQSALNAPDLPLDQVMAHPWRVASWTCSSLSSLSSCRQQRLDSLDWWTVERSRQVDGVGMEQDDESADVHDPYEGIDTSWNELGIAVIASQAWQDRPQVYQPWFQWRLWFPHVTHLMNPDLQQQQRDGANSRIDRTTWMTRGISLMKDILPVVPCHTLSLMSSFSINATVKPTLAKNINPAPPSHPVGTFQLLLNRMMAGASVAQAPRNHSTVELARLCGDLLAKYTPHNQVEIVLAHLLPLCPHPGLRPKLLDMLRPLVVHLRHRDVSAGRRLKREITGILKELGRYCDCRSDGRVKLQDADDLIDQVEYYVAACGLIQLGWHLGAASHGSRPPGGIALQTRAAGADTKTVVTLKEFRSVLNAQLQEWDKAASFPQQQQVPDQFFRLNLLDMSIEQLDLR